MSAPNLQDQRNKKDSSNPAQDFEQRLNDSLGQDDITKGIQDLENYANKKDSKQVEGANKPVEEQEEGGDWKNNTGQLPVGGARTKLLVKGLQFTKKRGGLLGLIAALGLGGGLLAGFFGPASMVINIMENFTSTNDSMSVSMERRFMKVFGYATSGPADAICQNNTKLTLRCKMGNISNSALKQLEKKGVVAFFDEGVTNDTAKRYPPRNPAGYTFTGADGKPINVKAADLTGYLANNPKMAAKILGPGGAINVSVRAWSGKYITSKFFTPFNLSKKGGLADGRNALLNANDRMNETFKKLRAKIPGADKASKIADGIKDKVKGQLGKAKKGGAGYVLAVGGCVAIKAPIYFATGAAAIQLAQVLPYVNETVLSPGGKFKAAGIEGAAAATPGDADAVNSLLTGQALDKKTNKMLAPVDSQYLQQAMGVNTGKPAVSQSFAPGFGFLTSSLVKDSIAANKATAPACNAIMSPAAMWSAFAVSSAVTVAASSTIILGVLKVIADFAVGEVVSHIAGEVVASLAKDAFVDLVSNDAIAKAEGVELGDVVGIGAMAYFSSASMSRHVPGLKMSQLNDYTAVKQESQDFERQMAVASLSPFDTSSKYTFLGSIVHNVNLAMITNGGYSGNMFSTIASLASIPASFINPSVGAAANFTESYCGYAEDFGLNVGGVDGTPDPANTPAINAAGLPCTGITSDQANMSSEEAVTLLAKEGWIDESKPINPNDSIEQLVKSGLIKSDTPISDFIESCGNPVVGDYLLNAAGCTTESTTQSTNEVIGKGDACAENEDGDVTVCGTDVTIDNFEIEGEETTGDVSVDNPRALTAISVFLLDYQLNASINGQDEPEAAGSAQVTDLVGRPDGAVDSDRGWTVAAGVDYSKYACDPRTTPYDNGADGVHTISVQPHQGPAGAILRLCKVPFASTYYEGPYNGHNLVSSTISTNLMNMLEAARAEGIPIQLNDGMRLTFDRGYYSQHTTGIALDLGVEGYNTICYGGNSVTGYGTPQAAQNACANIGGKMFEAYTWLQNNAEKYGFYNYLVEPWHWSTSGR